MGTSISRTRSSTWVVAPPDPDADVGEAIAALLRCLDDANAASLVGELVGRTTEAARRAAATGADLAAVLVAAVLDAVTSVAGPRPPDADTGPRLSPSLRRHLVEGAAASATAGIARAWVPRIVGSVEGLVQQCGSDAESTALMTAAMALIDLGGGLERRFSCATHGSELVAALEAAAGTSVSCEALGATRALIAANAAFERGVDFDAEGLAEEALDCLGAARQGFLEAGLRIEAAVATIETARIGAATDALDALGRYGDARAVLVEFDRPVEAARADRDLAFVVAAHHGNDHARDLVEAAAQVFADQGLREDAAMSHVVLACLARDAGQARLVSAHLALAADHLDALGMGDRAAALRGRVS